jgi:uncharacterized membrane protein
MTALDGSAADFVPVRTVSVGRPLHWLALGWRDFTRAPAPSVLHGLVVAAGGMVVLFVTLRHWYLLPGAVSGFVLIGPILATGLYELSRRLAAGVPLPTVADVVRVWARGTRSLVWLGLLLALAATAWVLVSAVLIALFVKAPITGLEDFLRHVVLSRGSNLFFVWISLGGFGAALVFAATVVSAPLLLDRDVDFTTALMTSIRAVGANPGPMTLWATVIMIATALSMATLMIGFVIVIPVVGHATWHAYRAAAATLGPGPRGAHVRPHRGSDRRIRPHVRRRRFHPLHAVHRLGSRAQVQCRPPGHVRALLRAGLRHARLHRQDDHREIARDMTRTGRGG